MAVYLAGPMTGIPDHNFPAFTEAAKRLRAQGYTVISPHELHEHTDRDWEYYIRHALRTLLDCDAVVLLPGWANSRGARLEKTVADAVGMPVTEYDAKAYA